MIELGLTVRGHPMIVEALVRVCIVRDESPSVGPQTVLFSFFTPVRRLNRAVRRDAAAAGGGVGDRHGRSPRVRARYIDIKIKKGWNKFGKWIQCRGSRQASAVRRAEAASDAGAQVGFRANCRNVHAAVDQRVDQGADDLRAIQTFSGAGAGRQTIEMKDLPVEQYD